VLVGTVLFAPPALGTQPPRASLSDLGRLNHVRIWTIHYRAHDGLSRRAYVVLPRWYGPHAHPPLPLIISPHGRGVPAIDNVRNWGNLPYYDNLAVVNPEGQGRKLTLYSWGDPGEIEDLARMPELVERALPWLRVDRRAVFVFGSSMGGQETLLLAAEHPEVLAGAAAFDAPTNMAARYFAFSSLRFGLHLQTLARLEFGGTPAQVPHAYAIRSPMDWARQLARSGVPLQIWWSRADKIVVNQASQSGALYRDLIRLKPTAPVVEIVGTWAHSAEFKASRHLPQALALFGLSPPYRAHVRPLLSAAA
jgi:pimeloyl-ACP methyl ester carboxylesterase